MSVANDERALWIRKEVLPSVEKALEKYNEESTSYSWQMSSPKAAFYASSVYFVHGTLGDKQIDLVIKTPPIVAELRALINCDDLFHNEIVFYRKFVRYYENIPKCIYASNEPLCNAVIAVENIEKRGFKIVPGSRLNLEYVLAAMKELGRFHARGYILKESQPEQYFEILKNLRQGGSDENHQRFFESIEYFIKRVIGMYGLRVNNDPAYWKKMESDLGRIIKRASETSTVYDDSIAVLCHGDFTKNNVLFKRTGDRIEATLIDFAQVKHSSPAIDVSTLLYVSTFKKDRTERFDDIFKAYHDALLGYLRDDHNFAIDLKKYSLETFKEDYHKHMAHGMFIASYFLPAMCAKRKISIMDYFLNEREIYYDMLIESNEDTLFEEIIELLIQINEIYNLNPF
ncbi:uncharacterized protein LOC107273699 [Cephus cinctus]|uniref:Uncharacterized protein LOC107273699 n=1 Tax=Cephus cinctus TaxID=211228 RepID=A0AAJ7FTK2_CEPCN|nr:uncharacterized protein LOC107273699 [Cephus cinctus]